MCPPGKIYVFLLPHETYQRYVQKILGTKTILSRGMTGKTSLRNFSDFPHRKKNFKNGKRLVLKQRIRNRRIGNEERGISKIGNI